MGWLFWRWWRFPLDIFLNKDTNNIMAGLQVVGMTHSPPPPFEIFGTKRKISGSLKEVYCLRTLSVLPYIKLRNLRTCCVIISLKRLSQIWRIFLSRLQPSPCGLRYCPKCYVTTNAKKNRRKHGRHVLKKHEKG